jgi:hypothetical protein
MSDNVVVSTSGPEEFAAMARDLIEGLAEQAGDPRAAELTDSGKMLALAGAVPETVTAQDLKLILSVAVVMLAEERR